MAYAGPPIPTFDQAVTYSGTTGTGGLYEADVWTGAGKTMFAIVVTANQPVTVDTGSSPLWSEVCSYGQGTAGSTTAVCVQVFKKSALSPASDTGASFNFQSATRDHYAAVGFSVLGDVEVAVYDGVSQATSATACSWPSVTTPVNDCLIVNLGGDARDSTAARLGAATNAALTTITEVLDRGTTSGNGSGVFLVAGGKETAGSTGATSASLSTASQRTLVTLALKYAGGDPGPLTGAQAATLGLPTRSAAGAVSIAGAAALTLALLTGSAGGGGEVQGGAAQTLGHVEQSASGSTALPGVDGAHSVTLAEVSQSAAGAVSVQGSSAKTLGAVSGASAGSLAVAGASSATLAGLSASSAGSVATTGTAAQSLPALASTAAGSAAVQGAAALTLAAVSQEANGAGIVVNVGASAVTLAEPNQSGSGSLRVSASGVQPLSLVAGSSAGSVSTAGASSKALGPLTYSASASLQIAGEATQDLAALDGTGDASLALEGAQDAALPLPDQSASGTVVTLTESVVPPERQLTVPFKPRLVTIAAKGGTFVVPPRDRLVSIAPKGGTYAIPYRPRKVVIE